MHKIPIICCLIFVLAGCASKASITKALAHINYEDGISAVEAKRIAQDFLSNRPESRRFVVSTPRMIEGEEYKRYQSYAWVVGFNQKGLRLGNIVCPECHQWFIVGVDKKSGGIRFFSGSDHAITLFPEADI